MFGLIPFTTNDVRRTGGSFDDFVKGFFNDSFLQDFNFNVEGNFNADIKETEGEYIVEADLPGVKKEDIYLDYRNNNLIISAKREETINEDKDNYIRRERHYGQFSRSFYVENVDESQIDAKFENGELYVVLPKLNKYINPSGRIEIK